MFEMVGDPGHGGTDRANRGPTGYIEADGVLTITKSLKRNMEKYKDVQFEMTRNKGQTMKLRPRGNMAAGASLFLSNHTNAGVISARGVEVFYSVDLPGNKELAEKMAAAIAKEFGVPNRGAKLRPSKSNPGEDYYSVIDAAQDSGCKHVLLVESLFHSNPEDEAILKNDQNLERIGEIEAEVIAEYFGLELQEEKNVTWEDVIKEVADEPENWINAVNAIVNIAKADGDSGELEIFRWLPDLILKIKKGV